MMELCFSCSNHQSTEHVSMSGAVLGFFSQVVFLGKDAQRSLRF